MYDECVLGKGVVGGCTLYIDRVRGIGRENAEIQGHGGGEVEMGKQRRFKGEE